MHPAPVQLLAQAGQRLVAAEVRVDVLVIGHVILVVGLRAKDWRQVQRVDPQRLQVVQALDDAGQVAAVKHQPAVPAFRRGRAPGTGQRAVVLVFVFVCARVAGGFAVREAVREDLVEHRALQPGRGVIIGQELEVEAVQRRLGARAGGGIPPQPIAGLQQEAVMRRRLPDRQVRLPPGHRSLLHRARHCQNGLLAVRGDAQPGAAQRRPAPHAQPHAHQLVQPGIGVVHVFFRPVMMHTGQPGGEMGKKIQR